MGITESPQGEAGWEVSKSVRGGSLGSVGPTRMRGSWATNALQSEGQEVPLLTTSYISSLTELGYKKGRQG